MPAMDDADMLRAFSAWLESYVPALDDTEAEFTTGDLAAAFTAGAETMARLTLAKIRTTT
jgi:hypothetical protein